MFFPETDFDILCKLSPKGDNLHKISEPVSGKNKEKIINLPSAEFVQRVVKVNIRS